MSGHIKPFGQILDLHAQSRRSCMNASSARLVVSPMSAVANGSWLDDKEPLVAAWTKSALAASERVRRGVGRGTHPTRTNYASLPGAAATGGANSPERRTWLFECLASVVHRIFTAIAARARQVSETV